VISHLLIIFNSTCSVIDKAFLSLSWGGEAGVSVLLVFIGVVVCSKEIIVFVNVVVCNEVKK